MKCIFVFLVAVCLTCCSSTKRVLDDSARSAAESIAKSERIDTVAASVQDKRDVLTVQETESETIEAIAEPEHLGAGDGGLTRCKSPGTRRTTTRTRTYTIDRSEAGKWITASSTQRIDSTAIDEVVSQTKVAEKVEPPWKRYTANIGRVLLVAAVCFFAFKYRKTIRTFIQ